MGKTCGDYGGTTQKGKPCGRDAGMGTDNEDGPCYDHTQGGEGNETMERIKKEAVELFEDEIITLQEVANRVGRSRSTLWRWAKNDSEFKRSMEEAKESQHDKRVEVVEDTLFGRIMSGNAAAVEVIFWLKVHGGEKYRVADRTNVKHSGEIRGKGQQVKVEITHKREEAEPGDAARITQGYRGLLDE